MMIIIIIIILILVIVLKGWDAGAARDRSTRARRVLGWYDCHYYHY